MISLVVRRHALIHDAMDLALQVKQEDGTTYVKIMPLDVDQARDLVASSTGISFSGPMPNGTRPVNPGRLLVHAAPRSDARAGRPPWMLSIERHGAREELGALRDDHLEMMLATKARISFLDAAVDLEKHRAHMADLAAAAKIEEDAIAASIEEDAPGFAPEI